MKIKRHCDSCGKTGLFDIDKVDIERTKQKMMAPNSDSYAAICVNCGSKEFFELTHAEADQLAKMLNMSLRDF